MGTRRVVRIDLTGKTLATHETHYESGEQTFADRIAAMRVNALEHVAGPVLGEVAQIRCDACGACTAIDSSRPELPAGWQETARGDLCPDCSADAG